MECSIVRRIWSCWRPKESHGEFQVARHQPLEIVAVIADELAQEGGRQQVLPTLALFLDNDLGEHRAGDVVARFRVIDHEVAAIAHHLGQVVECDVGRSLSIVETPVGVLLHHDGRRRRLIALRAA